MIDRGETSPAISGHVMYRRIVEQTSLSKVILVGEGSCSRISAWKWRCILCCKRALLRIDERGALFPVPRGCATSDFACDGTMIIGNKGTRDTHRYCGGWQPTIPARLNEHVIFRLPAKRRSHRIGSNQPSTAETTSLTHIALRGGQDSNFKCHW